MGVGLTHPGGENTATNGYGKKQLSSLQNYEAVT